MSICFFDVFVSPFLYVHSFTIFGAIVTNLNELHRAIAASGPRPATINELKNGENNRSAIYSKPVNNT